MLCIAVNISDSIDDDDDDDEEDVEVNDFPRR